MFNNKFIIKMCTPVCEDKGNTFKYGDKHYSISEYIQLDLMMSFSNIK